MKRWTAIFLFILLFVSGSVWLLTSFAKSRVGKTTQTKLSMPTAVIHDLATLAAKPFPLDHHPMVDLSADNRYRYLNGEKALENEKKLQTKMFRSKKFPLAKFAYGILVALFLLMCALYRREIAEWLKAKLIPPYNPHRQAQRSLRASLKRYGYDARFFVTASDVLRRYFGEILSVEVEDLTTQELVAKVDANPQVSKDTLKDLSALLHQADLIKFAGASPSASEVEMASDQAMKLIDQDKQEKF